MASCGAATPTPPMEREVGPMPMRLSPLVARTGADAMVDSVKAVRVFRVVFIMRVPFVQGRSKGAVDRNRARDSCKDDLRSSGQFVELAHGQHPVDLGTEVVLAKVKHVDRGFAGVEVVAGIVDHLAKLRA